MPATSAATPNVVGMTQAAAATALTAAGLTLGTVSTLSSATVPPGSVISQNPAVGVIVTLGSAVNITISGGAVAVPNVVGLAQAAASTALSTAGLVLGTVTVVSSPTVPPGSIVSQIPAAATMVVTGSPVNVSVSVGPPASFAYASNSGDGTISAYAINASGQLTALAISPIAVPGSKQLYESKIDPSGNFLYVVDNSSPGGLYGFAIQGDGSLAALNGGLPYATGNSPQSLAFDSTGAYLYVLNNLDNSISAFSLNQSNGVLTAAATYPISPINTNLQAEQMARAGNYLYIAENATNAVEVFAITSGSGVLTQGVAGSPFATDTGPFSLTVDPSGAVLYTANFAANSAGSISAFTINSTTGILTAASAQPLAIAVSNSISIDPQGKFLFVTENNGVAVYPINVATGLLASAVVGSPFAAGTNPYSVSVDLTDQFVYVANDGSANLSQFLLGAAGALTPMSGSPVGAGNAPDFIVIH